MIDLAFRDILETLSVQHQIVQTARSIQLVNQVVVILPSITPLTLQSLRRLTLQLTPQRREECFNHHHQHLPQQLLQILLCVLNKVQLFFFK